MNDFSPAFTTDWVNVHHDNWQRHLAPFVNTPRVRALEIGSWEGRSASWFCEHVLTAEGATLDCVDPWKGFAEQEQRFDRNTARFGSRVRKHKCDSSRWGIETLARTLEAPYDFIYIDGSHEAQDVLEDLVMCWLLLRPGGVLICDDYTHVDPQLRRQPHVAIDAFFGCRVDWDLLHKDAQFIVRKTYGLLPLSVREDQPQVSKPTRTRVHWSDQPRVCSHREAGARGVLTSASSPYWLTLKLQLRACREAAVDLAVADQGLLGWQTDWLLKQGAIVLSMPEEARSHDPQVNFDLAWDKPAICLTSPFARTLWIDADAVPLRNLERMFEYLDEGPWLSRENFVTALSARQVYLRMTHAIFKRIPPSYSEAATINTGVFGFRRGDRWVKEWGAWCDRILATPALRQECYLHDQHAAVALLCDPRAEELPRICADRSVNWPANSLIYKESSARKQYPWDAENCLDQLRNDHPEASVVHWLGRPKPFWNGQGREDGRVGTW